jgi:AraC family L-rhamnose operon regulatory protein RhaS
MTYSTVGRTIYPGYRMPLYRTAADTFRSSPESSQRFKILFFERGGGLLSCGSRRQHAVAPSIFCLNERELPALDPSPSGTKVQAVYFHPRVIHEDFTLESVYVQSEEPDWQDRKWLQPFVVRGDGRPVALPLGPGTAARLAGLFAALGGELDAQPDAGWPCRSRSYFFEILFLIHRIFEFGKYFRPDLPEIGPLSDADAEAKAAAVIQYLHTHYAEKITLDSLARIFYTNRTTLERQIREATGLPAMAYLARMRTQMAAFLLRDTEMDIPSIVARLGFTDPSQFRRAFRKHLGFSPTEYRKRYNWMIH